MVPTKTDRCGACHFPTTVLATHTGPIICAQCTMIADGKVYRDGSSPAEGLSRSEIQYIGTRVASLRRVQQQQLIRRRGTRRR